MPWGVSAPVKGTPFMRILKNSLTYIVTSRAETSTRTYSMIIGFEVREPEEPQDESLQEVLQDARRDGDLVRGVEKRPQRAALRLRRPGALSLVFNRKTSRVKVLTCKCCLVCWLQVRVGCY